MVGRAQSWSLDSHSNSSPFPPVFSRGRSLALSAPFLHICGMEVVEQSIHTHCPGCNPTCDHPGISPSRHVSDVSGGVYCYD